ncbi:MAG: hypothetical protein M5U26_12930 [Planctomycetota bacterium]|nr:hypothetical protein [Planctomycetota bacterium]
MRDRQIRIGCAFGLIGLSMLLMGCGGGQPAKTGKAKPPSSAPPSSQSRAKASSDSPAPVSASGAYPEDQATTQLVGIVKLVGSQPTPKTIDVSTDAVCKGMHEGGVLRDRRLVLGANGELANVLVYVSSGMDAFTFTPPQEALLLDQRGCEYVPRVFGMMVGQTVRIRNSDTTLHNINCQAKVNIPFNLSQAKQGEESERSFDEPEAPVAASNATSTPG